MATIITKNGNGVPSTSSLQVGELAIDNITGILYTKNSSNVVIEVKSNIGVTLRTTELNVVADEVSHLLLTSDEGDIVIRTDEGKTYVHNGGVAGTIADFSELLNTSNVTSINGETGTVILTTDDIAEINDKLYITQAERDNWNAGALSVVLGYSTFEHTNNSVISLGSGLASANSDSSIITVSGLSSVFNGAYNVLSTSYVIMDILTAPRLVRNDSISFPYGYIDNYVKCYSAVIGANTVYYAPYYIDGIVNFAFIASTNVSITSDDFLLDVVNIESTNVASIGDLNTVTSNISGIDITDNKLSFNLGILSGGTF